MKRNLVRLTLGLAAMAVILIGLESQAEAGRRHCRKDRCRSHRHHCCKQECCEEKVECCEEAPVCEEPACEESCCDNGCGRKHKHRRHRGGCCESSCDSGCDTCGGEVIHEEKAKDGESAPSPPADAPAEGEAPSA